MKLGLAAVLVGIGLIASPLFGALPPVNDQWTDFPVDKIAEGPGEFAADSLIDKPAGKDGPIVVRDGHFYTNLVNGKRIRFLGVNFCFVACCPTHEQAD